MKTTIKIAALLVSVSVLSSFADEWANESGVWQIYGTAVDSWPTTAATDDGFAVSIAKGKTVELSADTVLCRGSSPTVSVEGTLTSAKTLALTGDSPVSRVDGGSVNATGALQMNDGKVITGTGRLQFCIRRPTPLQLTNRPRRS